MASRFLTLALGCGAFACSLLVPDKREALPCDDEGAIGAPACDPGAICAGGECRSCNVDDHCGDGVDDDCDGMVDDGCPWIGSAGIGSACGSGASCPGDLVCVDPGGAGAGAPFCTRACCTSRACGAGAHCEQLAPGLELCRAHQGAGDVLGGGACARDQDCASNTCASGACSDTCCDDRDCAPGVGCRAGSGGLRCAP